MQCVPLFDANCCFFPQQIRNQREWNHSSVRLIERRKHASTIVQIGQRVSVTTECRSEDIRHRKDICHTEDICHSEDTCHRNDIFQSEDICHSEDTCHSQAAGQASKARRTAPVLAHGGLQVARRASDKRLDVSCTASPCPWRATVPAPGGPAPPQTTPRQTRPSARTAATTVHAPRCPPPEGPPERCGARGAEGGLRRQRQCWRRRNGFSHRLSFCLRIAGQGVGEGLRRQRRCWRRRNGFSHRLSVHVRSTGGRSSIDAGDALWLGLQP
eukprot:364988-Chlamydomonas_euryale.AAC.2